MTDFHSDFSTYRVLDAAINRATEGTRVIEDYTRMVMNDSHLSQQLKQLRHDLVLATEGLDRNKRIASRDSVNDSGRNNQTPSEYSRPSGSGVVQANMARVSQSLRSIEEFSKTIDASVAKKVEQLRYDTYTIEKAILTTMMSIQNLADIHLYVLVDSMDSPQKLNEVCTDLIAAGVDMIQLRDKRLADRELVVAGQAISDATRGTSAKWIMNDRCDLAVAAGADGVHLGQDDLSVADARRVVGPSQLIGVSTHSISQARQAVLDGANYIGMGPVFPSQTKSFERFVGTKFVKEVVQEIRLPSYAIGGIQQENLSELIEAGCHRVAVSGAVMASDQPLEVARRVKSALVRAAGSEQANNS